MAVEQRQRNDARGQQARQLRGGGSLRRMAAIGIHRGRHRPAQIDLAAAGAPTAEIPVRQHALEDAGFRNDKNQPRLVGGDLAQGRKERVFCKDDELSEVPLDLDSLLGSSWGSQLDNRVTLPHVPVSQSQ